MSAIDAALSGKPIKGYDDELRELATLRPTDAGFVISERSHADAWAALEAASPTPFLWRAVVVVFPVAMRDAIEGAAQQLITDESDPVWLTSGEEVDGHVVTHVAMRMSTIAALPALAKKYPAARWALRRDVPDLDAWLAEIGLKMDSKDEEVPDANAKPSGDERL